jgi:putative zinc finger/helix-turn-helix YgiT family protein
MKTTITHRRKVREQRLAEECPDCGKKAAWQAVTRVLPQAFRGHTLNVETACQECSHCGFRLLTDAQVDSLRRSTLKTYQDEAELLTGEEITEARNRMGWSQKDLATHSGLSIASIKRWELGLIVQTDANDATLRRALAPALDGGFQFLHLHLGVIQIHCFTETWKQGWEVEPVVALRQVRYSTVQKSCPQACWDSPLAFA